MIVKTKLSKELAYILGAFVADGTIYATEGRVKVEFSDGTSIKKDLKYSRDFIDTLRLMINRNFNSKINKFRKRNNQFILKIQKKEFSNWLESFGFHPGKKDPNVDIPPNVKSTGFEKDFWRGIMDCDGMIGKNTKNVTLWSMSRELCESFFGFLENNNIKASINTRDLRKKIYYYIKIKSPFVKKYAELIGFSHPRKSLWLQDHLKKEFYLTNIFDIKNFVNNNGVIEYHKIFNDRVFIIDGLKLLNKERLRKNISFKTVFNDLLSKGFTIEEIYTLLSDFKWKMSRGSTTSIKLPIYCSDDLKEIAQFVRLTDGGIKISRNYIKAWNEDPDKIKEKICKMFGIRPNSTSKKELLFDSGVLNEFFSKILIRESP